MRAFKLLIFSTFLLVLCVGVLTVKEVKLLNEYKSKKEQIAEVLNFENRIFDGKEYVGEWLPFLGDEDEKMAEWNTLNLQANQIYSSALIWGYVLFVIVLSYVFINYLYYQNTTLKFRVLGIVFVFAALSFLYLGLQTPFIELEAYSKDLTLKTGFLDGFEKTFKGRTYFLYQNKSVFQLIGLLFTGANYLVGFLLALFSIVFPLIKLVSTLIALIYHHTTYAQKSISIINKLGKWSMADVFVSAVFLAVFSFTNMNEGIDTSAQTLIGLYFFLAFVILSIVSGLFLEQMFTDQKNA
jgi:MFS family permease